MSLSLQLRSLLLRVCVMPHGSAVAGIFAETREDWRSKRLLPQQDDCTRAAILIVCQQSLEILITDIIFV